MSQENARQEKRYPFHWPVVIVFDESDNTYRGTTQDISQHGCCILTEHNVYSAKQVTVMLSLPSDSPGGQRRVVEARARMAYTVLSSGHRKFRCGIQFLSFKDSGLAALRQAIEKRSAISEV